MSDGSPNSPSVVADARPAATSPPPMTRRDKALSLLVLLGLAILTTLPGWMPGRIYAPTDAVQACTPWAQADEDYRPHNPVLLDQTVQFVPWTLYTVERLKHTQMRDGKERWSPELPLWNPYQQLGAPLIGNGQSAVFYPLNWLHAVVGPTWSWTLIATLKLFLAGAGLWVLAGRYGLGCWGRLLGSMAFMLCGFNVAWLNHPHTNVMALLPWAIIAIQRLIDCPTPVRVAVAALVLAAGLLGGHPGSAIHLLVVCGLVYVGHLALLDRRKALRSIPATLVALVGAVLLAGVQLVPLSDYVSESAAQIVRQSELEARSPLAPRLSYVVGILYPYANGYPPDRITPYEITLATGLPNTNELAGGFVGTIPLLLAGAAVAWRRGRTTILWAGVGAVCLAMAIRFPGVGWVMDHLPGLQYTQNARLLGGVALALAILAGVGLEAFLERWRVGVDGLARVGSGLRYAAMGLAGLAVLTSVLLMLFKGSIINAGLNRLGGEYAAGDAGRERTLEQTKPIVARIHGELVLTAVRLLIPAAVLGAAWGLLWMRQRRASRPALTWPWPVLAVAELLLFALPYNWGSPAQTYAAKTETIAWLAARRHEDASAGYRMGGRFGAMHPEWATAYGLRDVRGYDAVSHARVWKLLDQIDPQPNRQADLKRISDPSHPAWKLLALRYLITSPVERHVPGAGWTRVHPATQAASQPAEHPEAYIWQREGAMPRFWLAAAPQWFSTADEAIARVVAADVVGRLDHIPATQRSGRELDPRRTVVLDRQVPTRTRELIQANPSVLDMTGTGAGSVRVIEDRPERIRLAVEGGSGWLVVADAFDNGWTAKIVTGTPGTPSYQEVERPILPAYGALRAVPLDRRPTAQVLLEYQPIAFKHGLYATCTGAVLVMLLLGLGLISSMGWWPGAKDGGA